MNLMNKDMGLLDEIEQTRNITKEQLEILLQDAGEELIEELHRRARRTAEKYYGRKIYLRGLIEFTNYCKNNCYYCGIRNGNKKVERYRLTEEEVLNCCKTGYGLGFRTFVLQGGEDPYDTDERICSMVRQIKKAFPDCAITLSIGEKERESYEAYFEAGAERYLLRHETADEAHYRSLHPERMSLEHRKNCLRTLKQIGYQTGCGFMVGSPGQSIDTLYQDLQFIRELEPEMVGIGPFIPHDETPFAKERAGTMEETLRLLSILRLLRPMVLLPATTALGTIDPRGREKGILAGANVVMPNLSPVLVREKYQLYNHKICTGEEAAECRGCLERRMDSIGYTCVTSRGDYAGLEMTEKRTNYV